MRKHVNSRVDAVTCGAIYMGRGRATKVKFFTLWYFPNYLFSRFTSELGRCVKRSEPEARHRLAIDRREELAES